MRLPEPSAPRRRWLSLGLRIARLAWSQPERTEDLVTRSYDALAPGYDEAWTGHMAGLSLELVERLAPPRGARCLDLTCGTGFVTAQLAARTGARPLGVDRSAGMLAEAARRHPDCDFEQGDAAGWLRGRPAGSADLIACAWGLGYGRPFATLRQAARVLRPGGRVGIIDNSLFSLSEVIWASALTFAERPEALAHLMRVRFLPGPRTLAMLLRLSGFRVLSSWAGERSYPVESGEAAVARMRRTGAAAGFEHAARPEHREAIYARFAQVFEERSRGRPLQVTHRYLAAVAERR